MTATTLLIIAIWVTLIILLPRWFRNSLKKRHNAELDLERYCKVMRVKYQGYPCQCDYCGTNSEKLEIVKQEFVTTIRPKKSSNHYYD